MKLLDVINAPWAIQPDKLEEVQAIYATHLRGEKIDISAVEQRLGRPLANEPKPYDIIDGVAVVPIEGVSARRMNLMTQISGGVSTELAQRDIRAAVADPAVHSIILSIDSPGGTVDGTQALAATIAAARATKPVVTLATGTMASAAYWYGSAAEARYISDATTQVGSIGVIAKHLDTSGADAARGFKTTLVSAGKYKTVANHNGPVTAEDLASMQDKVDYIYSLFINDVASHLGLTPEAVHQRMGDGRVFIGQRAIAAGLVDGVATLDQLVQQLNSDRSSAGAARSARIVVPAATAAAQSTTTLKGTAMTLTRDQLQAQAPELLQALLAEGHAAGATAERARIQAVEAQALPGHEALIASLKFDGKTTGPEAALAVLNAERGLRATAARQLAADAPQPVPNAAAPAVQPNAAAQAQAAAQAESALPLEERCKARWERDSDVRNEFGTLAAFTAFTRAEESGRVKRLVKAA